MSLDDCLIRVLETNQNLQEFVLCLQNYFIVQVLLQILKEVSEFFINFYDNDYLALKQ